MFGGTVAIRQQLTEGRAYADATEMRARSVVVADGALSGGEVVIVEWTISGMSASDARNPTDKTPFPVQAIIIFEMDNDLIARSVFYAPWPDIFN